MKKLFIILLLCAGLTAQAQNAQNNRQRTETLVSMALALNQQDGNINDIDKIFESAVQLSPANDTIYCKWGAVYSMHAMRQENDSLVEKSFDKFDKALQINPNSTEAYFFWGSLATYYSKVKKDNNMMRLGLGKLSKAVEVDPNNSKAYALWGIVLLEEARENKSAKTYTECVEKLDKAIELNPESLDILSSRGYAYLSLGRVEKDLPKYRKQVEDSYIKAELKGSQSAAYNLACYYSLIKEKDLALKWLEKTIVMTYSYNQKMQVLDKKRISKDEDFDNIRGDKRYKEMMKRYFEKQ